MKEIVKRNLSLVRIETSKKEAQQLFIHNRFKLELIKDLKDGEITIYQQGDFIDLCRGGHLDSTSEVKHFKLMKLAGSYWRGDAKNPMLTRIYGTAFFSKQELDNYLQMLVEAEKRNQSLLKAHPKLKGIKKELDSLNDQRGLINTRDNLSDDARRRQLDSIEERERDALKRASQIYGAAKKAN